MLQAAGDRIVGRDGELRRLLDLLDAAAAGRPMHALISGDAGVGKTRLVTELAVRAADRGFTVLAGRCAELGDSIPYLPLADALRNATTGPDPAQALLDAVASRPLLDRLLPDRGASPPPADLPGLAQQQLFGAVLGLLAELAGSRPVLLVLEDVHWADRSTRDLLTFLSRVLHSERVAVVVTYRSDDLHRRHPLRPVVAELTRLPGVTAIELAPLGYADMAVHLRARAATALDATTLHRIVIRAEGNPYYGEELLAAGNDRAGTVLPTGLAALLLGRIERVSGTAQPVMRAAAVAGRRVEDEIIRRAAGLAEAEFEAAVREAFAHQLLAPAGTQGYAFRHALIREAIYADLLPGERTRLHARFAEVLADPDRLATVPGTAAELAHHCLASHDIAGAFTASVQAAQEAERLAAPAEAYRHYDEALALWERVSEPEKLAGMDRVTLGFCSATTTAASGDVARAVQKLRRLRGFLDGSTDPELASRVHERLAYFLLELDAWDDAVVAGEADNAFCAVRPPGHHAEPGRAMGFCLFNNIAVAARYALDVRHLERVLIFDWDVHHGNGTSQVFHASNQVLFVSILFAVGLAALGERGRPLVDLIGRASEVFFKIVGYIMWVAPVGAFGAIAFTVGAFGAHSLVSLGALLAAGARPGVTTKELDEAAEKFIRSQDATPAFKGYRGFPGSICASPNSMVVHGIPGPYECRRGDVLSIDVGVTLDGFVAYLGERLGAPA